MDGPGRRSRSPGQDLGQGLLDIDDETEQQQALHHALRQQQPAGVGDTQTTAYLARYSNLNRNGVEGDGDGTYAGLGAKAEPEEQGKGGSEQQRGAQSSTSVMQILRQMAVGDPIGAKKQQWKLTRAVVHLEDSWRGRVSPCPPSLQNERVRRLFKVRWHLRGAEVLCIHGLMALALLETPEWCLENGECFWSCYPDFSRNWHMSRLKASVVEAVMLTSLASIAVLDMVRGVWVRIRCLVQFGVSMQRRF